MQVSVVDMIAWVMRGTVLGALVVGLRTGLGFAMVHWPTHGAWMRILCLVALVAVIVTWGLKDGFSDRRAQPNPEHGVDLTMRWLKAALAGGVGSGAVAWLLDFLPTFDLGDNGLVFELTAGASFIVLLIFVPGMIGVGIGRLVAERKKSNGSTRAQRGSMPTVAV